MQHPTPPSDASAALPDLKSLTRDALRRWVQEDLGERAFRGDQIFQWVHGRGVRDFAEMTDLSKPLRERLAGTATLGALTLDEVKTAADGTRKLLLRTADGHRIESVVIPMNEGRLTQCLSSQVGCKMKCDFCLTARMPKRRDLTAGEIVDQVLWAAEVLGEDERLHNLVYMGMGEPLDNYGRVVDSVRILLDERGQNFSGRRITVSTSGVATRIAQLGHDVPVNLALSLNASTDAQRRQLMPLDRKWDIAALMEALEAFPLPPRRRITVEYVLLRGVNDTDDDARRLVKLLAPLRQKIKVNLIPFNPWPGAPYERPDADRVDAFGRLVRDARYHVTVRYSKGDDIGAACGQLDGEAVAA